MPFSKYLYSTIFDKWRMGFNPSMGLNFGRSVVLSAIQIAVYRGFKTIRLTGVDCNYNKPKDYFKGADSTIKYVNHRFVENPRLQMEPMLVLVQIAMEDFGAVLIDCTPGGRLKFIAKGNL